MLLQQKGFFESREKAKAAIMAGIVYIDGQKYDKAGTKVPADADIEVRGNTCPYVGRGGLKLEGMMKAAGLDLTGARCADIGASTGGFTDCMLQSGAEKVYAIDVGYGQLDWKLRNDSRVINMEKTNIRYLEQDAVEPDLDFISIDVSFISLKLVFPVASNMLSADGTLVCLVKPQFEAGREQVGKGGIVRDPKVHREVIKNVISYGEAEGLYAQLLIYSPIKGTKGNIEYMLLMRKDEAAGAAVTDDQISETISRAHEALKKEK